MNAYGAEHRQTAAVTSRISQRQEPSATVDAPAHPRSVVSKSLLQADGAGAHALLLSELRTRIAGIVPRPVDVGSRPVPAPASPPGTGMVAPPSICPFSSPPVSSAVVSTPLTFGIAAIDRRLPRGGLAVHGLHELKPRAQRDLSAALGLALSLAAPRAGPERPLLCVLSTRSAADAGALYGPGIAALGLPPEHLLMVEARRAPEVLWALEEGLRSGALAAVLGMLDSIEVMPARRLVLACDAGATPCILLTGSSREGVGVAHSRWRVAGRPSLPHPLGERAPGPRLLALTLERCRQGPSDLTWMVEWCDASRRFRLAAAMAAAAPEARRAGVGAR